MCKYCKCGWRPFRFLCKRKGRTDFPPRRFSLLPLSAHILKNTYTVLLSSLSKKGRLAERKSPEECVHGKLRTLPQRRKACHYKTDGIRGDGTNVSSVPSLFCTHSYPLLHALRHTCQGRLYGGAFPHHGLPLHRKARNVTSSLFGRKS